LEAHKSLTRQSKVSKQGVSSPALEGNAGSNPIGSSNKEALTSSSATYSTTGTQTYPSYLPPKSDTIFLQDPCRWWCNANNYDRYVLNDYALFGVPDPMLIKAPIALESAFNPNATSRLANAVCGGGTDYGLMQISPNCNNVSRSQLFNASYNLYWEIKFWANDYLFLKQKWGSSCNNSIVLGGVLELYQLGRKFCRKFLRLFSERYHLYWSHFKILLSFLGKCELRPHPSRD
jgi:hypothetical protein